MVQATQSGWSSVSTLAKRCSGVDMTSDMVTKVTKAAPEHCLLMWYHRDSNLGHTDFQSVALPTELWYLKSEGKDKS